MSLQELGNVSENKLFKYSLIDENGNVENITEKNYNEFIKKNTNTNLISFQLPNGEYSYFQQSVVTFEEINKINTIQNIQLAEQEDVDKKLEKDKKEKENNKSFIKSKDANINIIIPIEEDDNLNSYNEEKENNKKEILKLFESNFELNKIGTFEEYFQYINILTNENILYKGFKNKSNNVHKTPNHSYFTNDKKIAQKWYSDENGIKIFIIPKTSTINFTADSKQNISNIRKEEENFINNTDNNLIKLNTIDIGGKQIQYILNKNIIPLELGSKQDIKKFKEFIDNKNLDKKTIQNNLLSDEDIKEIKDAYKDVLIDGFNSNQQNSIVTFLAVEVNDAINKKNNVEDVFKNGIML